MSGLPGRQGTAPCAGRPCPLCGVRAPRETGGASTATRTREPRPVRCGSCGLVFVDPLPSAALSPATYGHDYYEPWQGREERPRLRLWKRRLNQVEKRSPRGALLDVGCGDGAFLKVARDAGWRVEGIEFSPEGARRAALRLGRPVALGDLWREPGLRGPFDVITLWHVLEHLADPSVMLRAVRERLRPGGLVVVAVPNLDNVPMQWAYRLARFRTLPLYEASMREPHLSHFSARTLSLTLTRHEFGDLEILPDRCALTLAKRGIDAVASFLSWLGGRVLTDAIVAFARVPR